MSAKHRQKGKMTKDSITLLPCFYFVEFPILASSAVSLYFLELTDVFKPVHSGYNCNDRSLSLPYIEPTHEVVPVLMLLCLSFAGPAAMILVSEAIVYCCLSIRRNRHQMEVNINAAGCYFNSYIRRAVRFVGVHVFGLCATALLTDIIQLSTGYHAPYFLTICKPNCTVLNTACNENSFSMDNICSGADPSIINSGRKSFPSQHATLAAFAAVYISMYFNAILTDSSKLLKPLLVFSFIICAIICGLTRIIQYKNHAIDVYLGFLIGGGIAMYLGLYAVGNFQPGEDIVGQQPPLWSLTDISKDTSRHLPMKNGSISDGIASHSVSIVSRNHRNHNILKRASADVETINSRSPMDKAHMVTFCNTLPRVHTAVLDEATHRNATIHASMDITHSKKLLSQWKSKNESRKLSLQVMEMEGDSTPPGGIEMRSSSEPSRGGDHGDQMGAASQYMKLASSSAQSPNNSHSIDEGIKVNIQSRPGSSQLVYIPEEMQENINNSPKDGSLSSKWQVVTEKSETYRTNSQPRIMQVIALSKQQGMFQTRSNSSNGMAAIRFETPTKQETTSIVKVEAHPENNPPTVPAPSTNGRSSLKWKSEETSSVRQSCELNDTNRDSESSEGVKDGNVSKNEKRGSVDAGGEHIHHLGIASVQVTSVEKSEVPSESMPVTFSRDSTLRRKGNIILIPERGNSLESTRSIFYKGISPTHPLQE